jgi:hypothetical protein
MSSRNALKNHFGHSAHNRFTELARCEKNKLEFAFNVAFAPRSPPFVRLTLSIQQNWKFSPPTRDDFYLHVILHNELFMAGRKKFHSSFPLRFAFSPASFRIRRSTKCLRTNSLRNGNLYRLNPLNVKNKSWWGGMRRRAVTRELFPLIEWIGKRRTWLSGEQNDHFRLWVQREKF